MIQGRPISQVVYTSKHITAETEMLISKDLIYFKKRGWLKTQAPTRIFDINVTEAKSQPLLRYQGRMSFQEVHKDSKC